MAVANLGTYTSMSAVRTSIGGDALTAAAVSSRICGRGQAHDEYSRCNCSSRRSVTVAAAAGTNGAALSSPSSLPLRYRSPMERSHAEAAAEAQQAEAQATAAAVAGKKPVTAVTTQVVLAPDERACAACGSAGAVSCATCAASGLYVDPVLECQGIIKHVTCLACGGSGSILCSACWGRGKA